MFTKKTRQEAIATQKNEVIRRRIERMTDEQWEAQQAQLHHNIASGAVAASVARMAAEAMAASRK